MAAAPCASPLSEEEMGTLMVSFGEGVLSSSTKAVVSVRNLSPRAVVSERSLSPNLRTQLGGDIFSCFFRLMKGGRGRPPQRPPGSKKRAYETVDTTAHSRQRS